MYTLNLIDARKFGLQNTSAWRVGDAVCVLNGKKEVECHMGESPGAGGAGTWDAGREALQSQGPGQPALSFPLLAKGQTLHTRLICTWGLSKPDLHWV